MDAHIIVRAMVALVTIYCILTNCRTAIITLKSFSADKLYPKFSYFSSKFAQQTGAYIFIAIVGLTFVVSGGHRFFLHLSELKFVYNSAIRV